MSKREYFHSTPADVDLFLDEKAKERKEQFEREDKLHDYLAWLHGVYTMKAVAAVLNGRKSRYPKEPLSQKQQSEVIVATEDMSDEQKQILTDQFFANLEEMQHQFNQTHNVQTGDGE